MPLPSSRPSPAAAAVAKYRDRVGAFANGKGDLASLWRDVGAFVTARAQAGDNPRLVEQTREKARQRFEFLIACKAAKADNARLCARGDALGSQSSAWCRRQHAFVRSVLAKSLRQGKVDAAAVEPGAKHLALPVDRLHQLLEAIVLKRPEQCPEQVAGFLRQCRAYAANDPKQCAASTGEAAVDGLATERDCLADVAALNALRAGDARMLVGGTDMAAYAAAVLGGAPACAEHFHASFMRELGLSR